MNVRTGFTALIASAALAGCASSGAVIPPARPVAVAVTRPPVATPPPTAASMRGLEAVIGKSAGELTRMFGQPRLEVIEGDATKLQFSGARCVLDAYLYPPAAGRDPVATYVDARRSDGQDVDKAACVAALRQ